MSPERRNVIAAVTLVALLAAIRVAMGAHSRHRAEVAAATEAPVPTANIAIADSVAAKAQTADSLRAAEAKEKKAKKAKTRRLPPSRNYLDDEIKPAK